MTLEESKIDFEREFHLDNLDLFSMCPGHTGTTIREASRSLAHNFLSFETLSSDLKVLYGRAQEIVNAKHSLETEFIDRSLRISREKDELDRQKAFLQERENAHVLMTADIGKGLKVNEDTTRKIKDLSEKLAELLETSSALQKQRKDSSVELAVVSAFRSADKVKAENARSSLFDADTALAEARQSINVLNSGKDISTAEISSKRNEWTRALEEISARGEFDQTDIGRTSLDVESAYFSHVGGALNFSERIGHLNKLYSIVHKDMEQRLASLLFGLPQIFGANFLSEIDLNEELNAFTCERIVHEIVMLISRADDATRAYRVEKELKFSSTSPQPNSDVINVIPTADRFKCARVVGVALKGADLSRISKISMIPPTRNKYYDLQGSEIESDGFAKPIDLVAYGAGEGDQPINWIEANEYRNHSAISDWSFSVDRNPGDGGGDLSVTAIFEVRYVS